MNTETGIALMGANESQGICFVLSIGKKRTEINKLFIEVLNIIKKSFS